MNLKIIGTGFGRTGTSSMRSALDLIGFGPCYHMSEVFKNPQHSYGWYDAANGKPDAWRPLLEGYNSVVDWPTTFFYRELAAAFPDAKILHTERTPAAWVKSIQNTILASITGPVDPAAPPERHAHHKMTKDLIIDRTFGGDLSEANLLRVYAAHNAKVRSEFEGSRRFLVFAPEEGWEPLCKFLGVPVPATPYPKNNTTEEFIARRAAMKSPV